MEENNDFPKASAADFALSSLKGLMGVAPLGSLGSELLTFFANPLEDRKRVWFEILAKRVEKLEEGESGIIKRLAEDKEFVSLLVSASIFAQKTHLKEKHDYLSNALVNGVGSELTYDVKQIYVNFIDELTLQHIKVLEFVQHYRSLTVNYRLKSYTQFYKMLVNGSHGVPILAKMEITTFRFLLKDLEAKGLIFISKDIEEIEGQVFQMDVRGLETDKNSKKLPYVRTTTFGEGFLTFVREVQH